MWLQPWDKFLTKNTCYKNSNTERKKNKAKLTKNLPKNIQQGEISGLAEKG